jgi:hypothetical protein
MGNSTAMGLIRLILPSASETSMHDPQLISLIHLQINVKIFSKALSVGKSLMRHNNNSCVTDHDCHSTKHWGHQMLAEEARCKWKLM